MIYNTMKAAGLAALIGTVGAYAQGQMEVKSQQLADKLESGKIVRVTMDVPSPGKTQSVTFSGELAEDGYGARTGTDFLKISQLRSYQKTLSQVKNDLAAIGKNINIVKIGEVYEIMGMPDGSGRLASAVAYNMPAPAAAIPATVDSMVPPKKEISVDSIAANVNVAVRADSASVKKTGLDELASEKKAEKLRAHNLYLTMADLKKASEMDPVAKALYERLSTKEKRKDNAVILYDGITMQVSNRANDVYEERIKSDFVKTLTKIAGQ